MGATGRGQGPYRLESRRRGGRVGWVDGLDLAAGLGRSAVGPGREGE